MNIASINAWAAFPMRLAYCAAKAAVVAMTEVLAIEWADRGVRVNAVAPGVTRTALVQKGIDEGVIDVDRYIARTPLHRFGEPDEIARAVLYLANEEDGVVRHGHHAAHRRRLERAGLDHPMSLVVITDSDLGDGVEEEVLEAAGHDVRRHACRSAADVIDAAAGAEALIVQWAPITHEVLEALPTVRFVSRLGIGVDMVDLDAATAQGVAVANTPDYCIDEVVAHTLAFILAATRGIVEHDRALRAGGWAPVAAYPQAARPSQRTVAVIGLGRIGSRVATQLGGARLRVLGVDPARAGARRRGAGDARRRDRARPTSSRCTCR